MITAETCTFQVGPYTVSQRPRFDNPAWPVYVVFLAQRLIGKSFSRPDLGCCEWLKHHNGTYATASYSPAQAPLRGVTKPRKKQKAPA